MSRNGGRNRCADSHQHRRPKGGMKARKNILSHPLHYGWPFRLPARLWVADRSQIVDDGVKPNVDDLRRITGDLDAPAGIRPGDARIPKPLLDKREDLVLPRLGYHDELTAFING